MIEKTFDLYMDFLLARIACVAERNFYTDQRAIEHASMFVNNNDSKYYQQNSDCQADTVL